MSSAAPVQTTFPMLVVTGFLGSGKTTLLNAMLADPAFADSAVIVNEFGEIGLDHLTIATARDNIVLLDAGCLCCAMLDSLRETVVDLIQRRAVGLVPPFRRILIETSGLADPAPILHAIRRDPVVAPLLALDNVVTLVDAVHGSAQLADHPEAAVQVALAETLVITKTDRLDGVPPAPLMDALRRINPFAEIVPGQEAIAAPARLLVHAAMPERVPHDHAHDHAAMHDAGIRSEAFERVGTTDWPRLARWTEALAREQAGTLLRVKALLAVDPGERPVLVDGVRGLYDYRTLPAWPDDRRGARIVFIGRDLDRAALAVGLRLLGVDDPSSEKAACRSTQ